MDSSRKPRFLTFVEAGLFNMHSESNFCLTSAFSCVRSSFNYFIFKNNRWHLMHNQASWLSSSSLKFHQSVAFWWCSAGNDCFQTVQFNGTTRAIQPFPSLLTRFAVNTLRTYSAFVPFHRPCAHVRPIEQWRTRLLVGCRYIPENHLVIAKQRSRDLG